MYDLEGLVATQRGTLKSYWRGTGLSFHLPSRDVREARSQAHACAKKALCRYFLHAKKSSAPGRLQTSADTLETESGRVEIGRRRAAAMPLHLLPPNRQIKRLAFQVLPRNRNVVEPASSHDTHCECMR